jgi:predicted negative regulator of RcsB-dependent stress response
VETFNPDDQVAWLKSWWKQYGKSLLAGVIIGLLLLAGLNYWKQSRTQRAETAALLYENMLSELQQGKAEALLTSATRLMQDYSGTPYAGKAALLAARSRFDAGDLAGARQHLDWAVKHAEETAVQHSARVRLGRLMLEQGETDAALSLIAVKDQGGFDSEYEELRGDLLLTKGDRNGARQAYRLALDKLPRSSAYAPLLKLKLENMGPDAKP